MGHFLSYFGIHRTIAPNGPGAFTHLPGALFLAGLTTASLAVLQHPAESVLLVTAIALLASSTLVLFLQRLRARQRDDVEERFASMAEVHAIQACSPLGVFYTDTQGDCRYVNAQYLAISGLTAEEARGKGWGKAIHPDDREWVVQRWYESAHSQSPFEGIYRFVRPDETTAWISCRAAAVYDNGTFIGYAGAVEDITSERLAEERVKQAHYRLSATLESIHDCFLSLDHTWKVTYINQAACEMFAKDRSEVVGSSLLDLFPDLENSILVLYCREVMEGGQPQIFETQDSDQDQWYEVRVYPAPDGVSVFYQDISVRKMVESQIEESMMQISEYSVRLELQQQELAEANDKLEALATTDGLTGLKNHRTFQDRLTEGLNGEVFPVSLLLLDVDKFKTFNDEFGHQAGDEVLIGVGRVLESVAHRDEFVARYGGEEFVIILPGQDAAAAIASAERFRQAIESEEWSYRAVTASFGASTATDSNCDKTTLISQADQALYASKHRGRNRSTHFMETRESTSLAA